MRKILISKIMYIGLGVTSITLLIEWNVTDAMRQGTLVVEDLPIYRELSSCGNSYSIVIQFIYFNGDHFFLLTLVSFLITNINDI